MSLIKGGGVQTKRFMYYVLVVNSMLKDRITENLVLYLFFYNLSLLHLTFFTAMIIPSIFIKHV